MVIDLLSKTYLQSMVEKMVPPSIGFYIHSNTSIFLSSLQIQGTLEIFLNLKYRNSQAGLSYALTKLKSLFKTATKNKQNKMVAELRSKVLQNAPLGAFCNTFDLH